jgi:site-specific DNA recombinase
MIDKHIRYFLYARKSSENEDKQVASIPSQIEEMNRLARDKKLDIVKVFIEEKSAKAPKRPVFGEMIEALNNGHAEGIICWKLDRLARNPVDGGEIIWMLQRSIIRHIQTFQQGYFATDNLTAVWNEFGIANQFVLDLSVNTKRGQRNKVQQGWLPHKPPLGYKNNTFNQPNTLPIYPDPTSFPLMKELWKVLLEKRCSLEHLFDIAGELGLKMQKGARVKRKNFYLLFRNPFYYGSFVWNGKVYPGKHEPMISKGEFDLAQRIMDGRSYPRAKTHVFAFTGLMRCGGCGAFITAEEKTKHQKNGNSHHYTYYRCTRRIKRDCTEPAISCHELESQILSLLGKISIPPQFCDWAIRQLKEEHAKKIINRDELTKAYRRGLDACTKKLDGLTNMRANDEISAEEYAPRRSVLLKEKQKYEGLIADTQNRIETWLERAEDMLSFAQTAQERFEAGTLEEKRYVLSCLGSDLVLTDKKLRIQLNKSLGIVQDVAPEVQSIQRQLEPAQDTANINDWDAICAQDEKWGE